ncbi:acyltransferase [Olivibacter sitiensis]|uniref:acyltransferase n=1 Tax=Olivibacter sitiensis TaxID=376470 RepID=UPI000487C2B3|nr:hypothetical protein [Olivibacter sitiensis]
MRKLMQCLTVILPMPLKRLLLRHYFKYDLHPTAHVGLSWVFPRKLIMGPHSKIASFNVAVHLDEIHLGSQVSIGRGNWITGFASGTDSKHFRHQPSRQSLLFVDDHSAITKDHHIDCTSPIRIGKYVTIAGYQSQLLTHSIDIYVNRQDSHPIEIGDYCFVGTNVTILGGAILPAYSVLGAKSLLNKAFSDEWKLYAGVPAKPVSDLNREAKYFHREKGFVY